MEGHPARVRRSASGLVVGSVAIVATMFFGDNQGEGDERSKPIEMAACEAIYNTQDGASFAAHHRDLAGNPIFQTDSSPALGAATTVGTAPSRHNQIQAKTWRVRPGSYKPILWVTYWTFGINGGLRDRHARLMAAGLGSLRRRRLERSTGSSDSRSWP